MISIIGASGSGKSTFLRCINFLERPNAGRIYLNDEEIRLQRDGKGNLTVADPAQLRKMRVKSAKNPKGAGDLIFKTKITETRTRYVDRRTGRTTRTETSRHETHYGFLGIEDVREVETLIHKVLLKTLDDDDEDEDEKPKKKKRRDEDDDEDEDEKPKAKKKSRDDDDDEDEPKAKKKKSSSKKKRKK